MDVNIRAALKKAADGMDRFNHARDLREAITMSSAAIPTPLSGVAPGRDGRTRPKKARELEDVVVDNGARGTPAGVDVK